MAGWRCFGVFVLIGLLLASPCLGKLEVENKNRLINGDFETDVSGWDSEGAVSIVTNAPLSGKGSLRIGPGKGSVRQRYAIGGLKTVYLGAMLKAESADVDARLRVQCYDAKNCLVMDLQDPLKPNKEGKKEDYGHIYFKTQAYTAIMTVSIEKTSDNAGPLYADNALLVDYDAGREAHAPLCNLDQYMQPLWKAKTVYNETVLLYSQDGKSASGKLLFTPDRILSVQDYSLSTTYAQDKDYTLSGKVLTRAADSRMSFLKDADLPKGELPWLDLTGRHIVVTYTHSDSWQNPIPSYQGERLPRTIKKLTAHSPLIIVANGDSITYGNATSGSTNAPPYMPTWPELLVYRLKSVYSNADIRLYNTALGGVTSQWGRENADSGIASLNPDLVLLAFGMNDFWSLSGADFRKNIQGLIERVKATRPNAEFILISCMQFDPAYSAKPEYRQRILDYATALRSLTGPGVALLDMTAISGSLFEAKAPKDLLGDPLHPNDFLARWYAQGVAATLEKISAHTPEILPVLGSRKPVATLTPERNEQVYPGAQVTAAIAAKTVTVSWKNAGAKTGDRYPWLFIPFDGLAKTAVCDISRAYATTYVALKFLKGSPEQTCISFWDDHEQNGNSVFVRDGVFDAAENVWYVPMERASNLRLNRIRGVAIGQEGNKEPVTVQIELPIRLVATGRKDTRPLIYARLPANVTVTVNADEITKDLADFGFGCHWDFCEGMIEGGDKYKAPLAYYKDLGFNMVRTSGTLYSPYDAKAVHEFKTRPNRRYWDRLLPLTLDENLALFKKAGFAQMAMILPYNDYYHQPSATRLTIREWAKEIPQNARFVKENGSFQRRYYELGNEIWAINRDMGGESKVAYNALPGDLSWYAAEIKKRDPDAKIMASFGGFDTSWPALMKALHSLDILNVSNYGWHTTYEMQRNKNELQWVDDAYAKLRAVDPKAAERIRFGVTEYAPHDWSNDWNNVSDLGHALWAFDKAAGGMAHPRVAFEIQWTWRWLWEHYSRAEKREVAVPYDVYPAAGFDLVAFDNRLSAQGKALRLLGRNRLDQVVATTCGLSPAVVAVAVRSRDGKQINLFLLNKDYEAKRVKLNLKGLNPTSIERQVFTGTGLNDPEPTVTPVKTPPLKAGATELTIPETSITLLTFRR